MPIFNGIDGIARSNKAIYAGVDGIARKVTKVYAGVNNTARLVWSATAQYNPPANVTTFTATPGNAQITLTWGDPEDSIDPIVLWAGTKIIRSDHPPTNEFDGTLVVDNTIRNQFATTGFIDTGLDNGVTYYYQAFPHSTAGAVNRDEANRVSAVPVGYRIYGVRIDETNSNPYTAVTYTDDSLTAPPDNFDERPCMLYNGKVQYYLNPNNFALREDGGAADITTGAEGDVMIQFPKKATLLNRTGTYLDSKITEATNAQSIDSNFRYYGHTREIEGDRDYLYIGAYLGNALSGKLRSLSGKAPTVSQAIGTFRTQAQANGAGYDLMSFYPLTFLQQAFLNKYKNLDSQTALGQGYVGGTAAQTTGATNTNGMYYGSPTSGTGRVKFAGIEDFWGNLRCFIDGLYSNSNRYILTAFQNFNDTGSGYTNRGQGATANISGYMSQAQGSAETGLIAKVGAGSATTYYCDEARLNASCMPYFGGDWAVGSAGGAFFLYVIATATTSIAQTGARLMYL